MMGNAGNKWIERKGRHRTLISVNVCFLGVLFSKEDKCGEEEDRFPTDNVHWASLSIYTSSPQSPPSQKKRHQTNTDTPRSEPQGPRNLFQE